jgi:hypothetical protein
MWAVPDLARAGFVTRHAGRPRPSAARIAQFAQRTVAGATAEAVAPGGCFHFFKKQPHAK